MIIKDLWIISKAGLCRYHYGAPFSNYRIDETLFAGFIAALSTFTDSMTMKIAYIKMQEDEMHFTTVDEIIVVAIVGMTGTEQKAIDQLLSFIGRKFLENFSSHLDKANFSWDDVSGLFTKQIEFIWADSQVYEEAKRAIVADVFEKVMRGVHPPDVIHWKTKSLFMNSGPDEIAKTIDKITKLFAMAPYLVKDPVVLAGIDDAVQRTIEELSRNLPRKRRSLLVVSNDKSLYEGLFNKCLPLEIFCIPVRSIADLKTVTEKWSDSMPYDVIYIDRTIALKEYEMLAQLQANCRIYVWLTEIPQEIKASTLATSRIILLKQFPESSDLIDIVIKDRDVAARPAGTARLVNAR